MIILERTLPDDFVGYRFLARRFPTNTDFAVKYRNLCAGIIGELLVDREMDELILGEDHFIFRNYESKSHTQKSIQIDTLYISKKFILTLEVKNISGHVRFEQMQHQFIRTKDSGEMESFTNPVNQAIRHQQWLQQQLVQLNVRLPIISAIIFTNPSTIISSPPSHMPVFHLSGLRYELPKWNTMYKECINDYQLQKLKNHFINIYSRRAFNMPSNIETIAKSVLCPNCHQELFYYRTLRCRQCTLPINYINVVLNEFRVIWGNTISVRQLYDYCQFRSTKSAYLFIKSKEFQKVNNRKLAQYVIPTNIEPINFDYFTNRNYVGEYNDETTKVTI